MKEGSGGRTAAIHVVDVVETVKFDAVAVARQVLEVLQRKEGKE